MKRTVLGAAIAAVLLVGTAQAATTEVIIYKQPNFRGASYLVNGEVANLEGGLAREGSSLIVKGGYWEVCDQDHFKGRCRVIEPGEYPRLPPHWDEKIVSVRFVGTDPKLAQRVAMNDRKEARALWFERREAQQHATEERRGDWRGHAQYGAVELYDRPNFRGRQLVVDENVRNLRRQDFDDRASSMIVHSGTWQVCSEPRFEGRCQVVRPGQYPRLAALDDSIGSLRQLH